MKLKDLDISEYPRERLLKYGVENLSDNDLLSIVLRCGTKGLSVKEVSSIILNKIGNLSNLSNITFDELLSIKGIGKTKAITLISCIELAKRINSKEFNAKMPLTNPKDINDVYKKYFLNIEQVKFLVIFLNNKKQLIKHKILFIGTIDKSIVHPREIIKEACSLSSSYIIVMHNHPSLDVNPSNEDIAFTLKLKSIMQTVGIPLLDHIITDGVNYYSFYENNVDFK